jgi:CDP-4-dehydro-6-deoxyglucose reductase
MSFSVKLEPSGHTFVVPEGQSILQAGLAAGYLLPYSCRAGGCTTCKGKVLSGRFDHGVIRALTAADREAGYALLCKAKPLSDVRIEVAELTGVAAIVPKEYPCRVVGIDKPAPDVAVLRLRVPQNEIMFFLAGQYIDILLPDGRRRSYSLAVRPDPVELTQIELHIRHVPGGAFTDHVFSNMKLRDVLRFEGPFGSFFLRDSDKPAILLASGTGFAPVKAMVEHAIAAGDRRPLHIYWGGRRREDLYRMELARLWAADHPQVHFIPVLSEPGQGGWDGRTGLVHRAVMDDIGDLSSCQVYACGSPLMVDAARSDFVRLRNLPPDQFFADAFLTEADGNAADSPPQGAFT